MKSVFMRALLGSLLFLMVGSAGQTHLAPTIPSQKAVRFVVQVPAGNLSQVTRLNHWLVSTGFDVAGMNWKEGKIEVITTEQGIEFLRSKGFTGSIKRGSEELTPDQRYMNPDRLQAKLTAIAQAYPQFTHLEAIGRTIQGRPILALLISDTPQPTDPKNLEKPAIIFDGLHHAREIMTPEIVVDVGETLLKSLATNQRMRQVVHKWQIWLVPMLNPDGSNLVFTSSSMWRKNAHADGNNIYGVDLNRNYSYRWNGCNGSSGSKGAQDYRGSAASSEPEVQAISTLAARVRPTASLSYHSYSELVLLPYGCQGDYTGEKEMMNHIGKELSNRLPSDGGKGNYTVGTPWETLYAVDGDSMDYLYAAYGATAVTFEVNQDFQPPYSVREPTLKKHRNAWGYFLDFIDQNLLTVNVVDGRSGKPVEALLSINTIQHTKGELPFKTNTAGHFFKVLEPGQYIVTAKLSDGRTAQVQIQMNGQPQAQTISIK